jgi:hypothetical protein
MNTTLSAPMMPAMSTRAITVQPHGRAFRLVHPDGSLYVADRSGEAWAGMWARPDAIPAGMSPDFAEGEARLLLHHLRTRATGGRKAAEPVGGDGKLVADAMAAAELTQAALAARFDPPVSPSFLSKVLGGTRPLSAAQRVQLQSIAAGAKT